MKSKIVLAHDELCTVLALTPHLPLFSQAFPCTVLALTPHLPLFSQAFPCSVLALTPHLPLFPQAFPSVSTPCCF